MIFGMDLSRLTFYLAFYYGCSLSRFVEVFELNLLEGTFLTIFVRTIYEPSSKDIISKHTVFTMTNSDYVLTIHAVEFHVNSITLVQNRIKNHRLNGDSEHEVDYLEWSTKDIPF